jgi:predicted alpha/beta-fold hydrolase
MSFTAGRYIHNPHLQTILPLLLSHAKVDYHREELCFQDGDFTEIVWSEEPEAKVFSDIIVLFHGLGGSSESAYIQEMMAHLKQIGHLGVLMHFRGCGSRTNNTIRSYHAGETEDARFFINTLKQSFPQARLHAIGYSLGGNMLLKLISTYTESSPLDSAIAVSTPLELEACTLHLSKGLAKIYQRYLLKELKAHLLQKAYKLDLVTTLGLSVKRIKAIKSIYEFDDIYTAPVHGFSDAHEYYALNSSKQFLAKIKIPTLMIHAYDDPFMPASVFPSDTELSKSIQFELYENGGHVGFIEGSLFRPSFWLQKRIQSFIESV